MSQSTNNWQDITFDDIFEISSSKRVLQKDWQKSGIPFYRAREIVKLSRYGKVDNDLFISPELFDEYAKKYGVPQTGDIMVSAVGTLGACYIVQPKDKFYFKDASVLQFSPKVPIDTRFIKHAFESHEILDQIHSGSGSTVGTYTISRAKETRIKLPPLEEQKRIAAILDQTDALRQSRRRAITRLNDLSQSIFYEMFGDPDQNPFDFPVEDLGVICDVRDGTHDSPKYIEDGYPLLTSKNFSSGTISFEGAKNISEQDFIKINKRSKVDIGDIVMPMIGTIGTPVIIKDEPNFAIKNVALFKFKERKITADYIHAILSSPFLERNAVKTSRGGTQKFIALGDIRSLKIPVPPEPLQVQFSQRLSALNSSKKRLEKSLESLENLFLSLQQRAFRGEL